MASEPETPGGMREDWMVLAFVGLIVLAVVGGGVLLLFL
jgi:hypothetical protein